MKAAAGSTMQGLLDLLFPPVCLVCGELAGAFCAACRAEVRPAPEDPEAEKRMRLAGLRAAGMHEGALRRAVLRLKFQRKVALAAPLGELLAGELESAGWKPEAIVPVPAHWSRIAERGFNQAELLAGALARETGLPVLRGLRRVRRTRSQVGLGAEQRRDNLRGAFRALPRCRGVRALLLDDVRTTGATLAAAAETLRKAGARPVYALTVTFEPTSGAAEPAGDAGGAGRVP